MGGARPGAFGDDPATSRTPAAPSRNKHLLWRVTTVLAVFAVVFFAVAAFLLASTRASTRRPVVTTTPTPSLSTVPTLGVPCPTPPCGSGSPPPPVVVTVTVQVPVAVNPPENMVATTWIPLGSMVVGLISAVAARLPGLAPLPTPPNGRSP